MTNEEAIVKFHKLAVGMARRYLQIYRHRNCAFATENDLIQEGYIGIMSAVRKANMKNRELGLAYVRAWIRQRIARYCNQNMNLIRWPSYNIEDIKKRLALKEYKTIGETPVQHLEIEQLFMLPDRDHEVDILPHPGLLDLIFESVSNSCRVLESNARTHKDSLGGKRWERLRFILELRAKDETFDEIGRRLGLSRARIKQMEAESIFCLRRFLFGFEQRSEFSKQEFFTEEDLTRLEAMVSCPQNDGKKGAKKKKMGNWRSEHGPSYNVPNEILNLVNAGVIQDLSWKNDTSPKFGKEGSEIYLWVEHPDEDRRELGGARFMVSNGDKTVIETEEVNDAIRVFIRELR